MSWKNLNDKGKRRPRRSSLNLGNSPCVPSRTNSISAFNDNIKEEAADSLSDTTEEDSLSDTTEESQDDALTDNNRRGGDQRDPRPRSRSPSEIRFRKARRDDEETSGYTTSESDF